jgi:hypothetical protein
MPQVANAFFIVRQESRCGNLRCNDMGEEKDCKRSEVMGIIIIFGEIEDVLPWGGKDEIQKFFYPLSLTFFLKINFSRKGYCQCHYSYLFCK